jgi:hypothetical protein
MTCKHEELLEYEPSAVVLKELTVRVVARDEFDRAGDCFNEEHYLWEY